MATSRDGKAITTEDLRVAGAMTVLLRDAIKPNLLQTLEGGPAYVHCGPFANIAHGNSSIIADRVALSTSDIVVTEAGFGADMGAEKFFDIKCRASGLRPDAAVVVATVRALKMHGGVGRIVAGKPLDPALTTENVEAVRNGGANLAAQVELVRSYGVPVIVAMNAFPTDTPAEFEAIREVALAAGARDAVVTTNFAEGGKGAEGLAAAVWDAAEQDGGAFRLLYPDEMPLREKIETIATKVYGAAGVDFAPAATKALAEYEASATGTCRSAWPRPTCRCRTTRTSRAGRPASASRSATSAWPPVPGSSTRSRATCGRCRGCPATRPARRSTSTRTGTSSGSSDPMTTPHSATGVAGLPPASAGGPAPIPAGDQHAPVPHHGPTATEARLDALMPGEMAAKAAEVGVRKAAMGFVPVFVLGILAGAFIALGAAFATTVSAGAAGVVPYGIIRLLAGLAFSLGLILVIVGGAELFTGNNLLAMAWASRRISTGSVIRNWVIVYAGNFVGAIGTAVLIVLAGQYAFGGASVGAVALSTAATKVGYGPLQAFVLGILCNGLVCLAVWLTYSARTTTDRILAIVPPIAAFVAMGFEHSVANMYFIPAGMLIRAFAPDSFWTSIDKVPADYASLDVAGLVGNLVPVTLGNIVGGTILVGAVYWLVYLRGRH